MSITDVADSAKVSRSTVSRVLNGYPHVSAAARAAVEAAAKAAGYRLRSSRSVNRPFLNSLKRNLRSVAVLFPDADSRALCTPLSGRLLHGISESLRRVSSTMVVARLHPDGSMPRCIEKGEVDGVIVRGTTNSFELRDSFATLPCVWVFESGYRGSGDIDMVLEDNVAIGKMAALRLVGRGHRRLAFVNLLPEHPSFRVRRAVFAMEAERLGATVLSITGKLEEASHLLDRLVSQPELPSGIFVPGRDSEVVQVYRGLKDRGMRTGAEIDLISCSNDPHILSALEPSLANIDIQPEVIGRAAVDLLYLRIANPNENRRRMTVPPVMVESPGLSLKH